MFSYKSEFSSYDYWSHGVFWAAWEGHGKVIRRLLQEPRARNLAQKACHGLGGVPERPVSPMEVAYDRWGKDSDPFVAFGLLNLKGNQNLIPLRGLPVADG